jgi:hypothetical protein
MTPENYTLTTKDAERWRSVVPMDVSITASLEYLRIFEAHTGLAARLFVVGVEKPLVAYPYLVRPIANLPFAEQIGTEKVDTTSPEYRGPLALPGASAEELAALDFPAVFSRHCREAGIVAEFAHLNPWNGVGALVEASCVKLDREIVYVDLTGSEDDIWTKSLSSDGRRQTRQGHRAGVTVRRASTPEDVLAFHRLHTQTMERRQALDRYFHTAEHFMAFHETMPENAFFALAEFDGHTVAGGLFFQDATEIYWHLSAADLRYTHARPVNVYVYETIRAALGTGRQRMIMGGGYGKDDGVFRFKTNFSPLRAPFCTYERIHDPVAYAALSDEWARYHGAPVEAGKFFPSYRASPPVNATNAKSPAVITGAMLMQEIGANLLV